MHEKMVARLQLASTLGHVGAILAIISTIFAIVGGIFLILTGSIISAASLGNFLEPLVRSEIYAPTVDAMFFLQNLEFLKLAMILVGILILIVALIYLFFDFKMLKFAREYRHNLEHQHTIYMIIFSTFLIFSGRIFSGILLLISGILAYTVKEYQLDNQN